MEAVDLKIIVHLLLFVAAFYVLNVALTKDPFDG